MKFRNLSIIFFLSILFLPAISSADLKPAYSFANGCGKAWSIFQDKTDIAKDKKGQVWAICNGSLYLASPEGLIESGYSEQGMQPVQFAKSPNGQLYILWQRGRSFAITNVLKDKTTYITSLQVKDVKINIGNEKQIFFYVDSFERFWITGRFPAIYFWEKEKWTQYEIKPEDFNLREDHQREWPAIHFSQIFCTEVSEGKMLFWSYMTSEASLDFLLTFSNGRFGNLRHISSLPHGKLVSAVKVFSDGLFWIAMQPKYNKAGLGIFEVDLKKEKVSQVLPLNSPLIKLHILGIFSDRKKEIFLLCCDMGSRNVSLWKTRRDKIKLELERVESNIGFHSKDKFSFLISRKGHAWLGTSQTGLWLKLRRSHIWRKLDWHSGFPIVAIDKIKEDRHGNIWFCGSGYNANGLCCLSPKKKEFKKWLKEKNLPSNWNKISLNIRRRAFMFDENGCLWAMLNKTTFGRFDIDKKKWIHFSLRESFRYPGLAYDDRGCIWIFGDRYEESKVALLEEGEFYYFSSLKSACESVVKKDKDYNVYRNDYPGHTYHFWSNIHINNKKACFNRQKNNATYLNYFNGINWKRWKAGEIDVSNPYFNGPPFFDKHGILRINTVGRNWCWNGSQWKASAYLEGPSEIKNRQELLIREKKEALKRRLNKLDRFFKDKIINILEVDDETMFVQTKFCLWKTVANLWIKVDEGIYPQMGDSRIELVCNDKHGNLYIKTFKSLFVRLADHSPETTIAEKSAVIDKLPISFSFSGKDDKTPPDKLRFSWSLNDGEWSSLSYNKTISFERLANGEHILKVKALDEELNYDPTPAVARFTVKVDAKNLLAENLEMLKSSDYKEREKAIRNLVHIGRKALPELKKLRAESKDDDLRWWIDVVMQQIEQNVTSK